MSRRKINHLRRPVKLPLQYLKFFALLGIITVTCWYGYQYRSAAVYQIEEFVAKTLGAKVEHIIVESMVEGSLHTSDEELRDSLQLKQGDSLVGFNASDARSRVENLPWVEVASVERQLPSTVKVEIFEYRPLARLEVDGDLWLVDKKGHKIISSGDKFKTLPIISGAGADKKAAELFVMLEGGGKYSQTVVSATFIGERRWDLHFVSGVTVQLPEKNPQLALDILAKLDRHRNILELKDGMVDLRIEDKITIRIPPKGEMKERTL